MPHSEASRWFPYSTEQVFGLLADIERYPEFVPGYLSAHIRSRDAGHLQVEQQLGLGPLRQRFTTEAQLSPPQQLQIRSHDARFKTLAIDWQLHPEAQGCQVRLTIRAELRSRPMQLLASHLLPFSAAQQLACFLTRAHQLYGARP